MNRPVEILVVEDNPADAHLAKVTLLAGSIPKRISVVTDGAQAIEYIRRKGRFKDAPRPDLVLLDLNLPKFGGMEVLKEVKGDPHLRSITVIVLSTSSYQRDINTAYGLLANCYIVKPVELDDFYAMMRTVEEFWMGRAALPHESESAVSESGGREDGRKENGAVSAGTRACGRIRSAGRLLESRQHVARARHSRAPVSGSNAVRAGLAG